ncbi:MAG: rod-binding protein [Phycisphaeraceae bacterium]
MIEALSTTTFKVDEAPRPAAQRGADPSAPVFAGFMDRARSEGRGEGAQLREAAEKLVSTTLIMPLFEQMRSDPLAANLVHGGRTEKVFQQQMDQVLADRIAGATRFDLVDAVYKQLSDAAFGGGLKANG